MRAFLLFLSFFIDVHVHAEMIFLDLNNAEQEIAACRKGVADNNQKYGRSDAMEVVSGVIVKDANGRATESEDSRTHTYHALRAKVISILCQPSQPGTKNPYAGVSGKNCRPTGRKIDSMVISGEDGNGHFFGTSGDFQQNELQDLTKEFKPLGANLKSAALWGCYTTSLHGAEQYWLNNMPNMQFTMGFTLQGPEKSRPANHHLLKQFCEKHEQAVAATSKDQLCAFYNNLSHLTETSVGLCNRQGIVSSAYKDKKGQICFTAKELHERCGEFTKNEKLQKTYDDYMSGRKTPDPNDTGEPGGLRDYYNQLNLWRHCAEKFKTDRGYDIPYPPEVIRLIKYSKIRENLAELNKRELADYDRALKRAGLGDFAVGDLGNKQMTRAMLNSKIQKTISALRGETVEVDAPAVPTIAKAKSAAGKAGGLDDDAVQVFTPPPAPAAAPRRQPATKIKVPKDPTLLRMAECLRMTIVNMDWRCTQFKNINIRMGEPSSCLKTYENAKKPEDDDDAC